MPVVWIMCAGFFVVGFFGVCMFFVFCFLKIIALSTVSPLKHTENLAQSVCSAGSGVWFNS